MIKDERFFVKNFGVTSKLAICCCCVSPLVDAHGRASSLTTNWHKSSRIVRRSKIRFYIAISLSYIVWEF